MADLVTVLAVVGIVALSAWVQSLSGFGFALVGVPFIAMLTDPLTAVVAATMLGTVYSAGAALHQRSRVDWGALRIVSITAVLGMPLGLLLARRVSPAVLSLVIGVVVIVFALMLARAPAGPATRPLGTHGAAVAGVASGALLTSTGMNGPPLVFALKARGLDQFRFRATLQATFVLQDVFAIVGFAVVGSVAGSTLTLVAASVPALLVGWWAGQRILPRIDERRFAHIVVGMLVIAGLLSVLSAFR